MADPSKIVERSTTGDITTSTAFLRNVTLTGGSDAATAVFRAGGSSGTVILTVKAATGASHSTGRIADAVCSGGIHVTLTGTGPSVSVAFA